MGGILGKKKEEEEEGESEEEQEETTVDESKKNQQQEQNKKPLDPISRFEATFAKVEKNIQHLLTEKYSSITNNGEVTNIEEIKPEHLKLARHLQEELLQQLILLDSVHPDDCGDRASEIRDRRKKMISQIQSALKHLDKKHDEASAASQSENSPDNNEKKTDENNEDNEQRDPTLDKLD